ncbi:unnamed protein product, partial [Didymodactylos carnosus]
KTLRTKWGTETSVLITTAASNGNINDNLYEGDDDNSTASQPPPTTITALSQKENYNQIQQNLNFEK